MHVIDLLEYKLFASALLRTVVWAFCVASCLAEPGQEPFFRRQAEALQPTGLFGTVNKAFEMIKSVWQQREATRLLDMMNIDMAGCFGATAEDLSLI